MPVSKSYFTGSIFIDNVIRNPFIISLLITVLALIIFYAINSNTNQNVKDKIKSGFWLLIVVAVLTSIHFVAVKKYFASNSITQNLQDSATLISNESSLTAIDEPLKSGTSEITTYNTVHPPHVKNPVANIISPNGSMGSDTIIRELPSSI
jgi:cytoskeletal protein RodZ